MRHILIYTATIVSIALFFAFPALSQNACALHGDIIKHLATKYDEAVTGVGLDARGNLIEVLSSDDGKTWTIVFTKPGGPTCVMSSGHNWIILKPTSQVEEETG